MILIIFSYVWDKIPDTVKKWKVYFGSWYAEVSAVSETEGQAEGHGRGDSPSWGRQEAAAAKWRGLTSLCPFIFHPDYNAVDWCHPHARRGFH